MISIALLALTIFHPGSSFPEMRGRKKSSDKTNEVERQEKSGNESSDSELKVEAEGERDFV